MNVKIYGQLRKIDEAQYQQLCRIAKKRKLSTIEEAIECIQMK